MNNIEILGKTWTPLPVISPYFTHYERNGWTMTHAKGEDYWRLQSGTLIFSGETKEAPVQEWRRMVEEGDL